MVKLKSLAGHPEHALKNAGWEWMLGTDTTEYVVSDMVVINETQATQYYEAANTLYDMLVEAGSEMLFARVV